MDIGQRTNERTNGRAPLHKWKIGKLFYGKQRGEKKESKSILRESQWRCGRKKGGLLDLDDIREKEREGKRWTRMARKRDASEFDAAKQVSTCAPCVVGTLRISSDHLSQRERQKQKEIFFLLVLLFFFGCGFQTGENVKKGSREERKKEDDFSNVTRLGREAKLVITQPTRTFGWINIDDLKRVESWERDRHTHSSSCCCVERVREVLVWRITILFLFLSL